MIEQILKVDDTLMYGNDTFSSKFGGSHPETKQKKPMPIFLKNKKKT
jgi:hypothetical protein